MRRGLLSATIVLTTALAARAQDGHELSYENFLLDPLVLQDEEPGDEEAPPDQPEQEEETFRFYWKRGIRFESSDGSFSGQIGGRVHYDSIFQKADDELSIAGDPVDENKFRRARIFIKGLIQERFEFKVEWDFAGGGTSFTDVYLRLKGFPFSDTTLGHFKEPVGLEQLMSSNDLILMERALTNALVPGRSAGLMVNGTFADMFGTYAIGVFRKSDGSGDSADATFVSEGDGAASARLTFVAMWEELTHMLLHLGLALSRRSEDPSIPIDFDVDFGLDSDNFSLNTSTIATEHLNIVNFEALFMLQCFLAFLEYTRMEIIEPSGGVDPVVTAWALTMSLILTGERRPYNMATGTIGGVDPKTNPFGDPDTGDGAIELALRIDFLDLSDSGDVPGGAEIRTIMIGLNWYPNGNVKIMINLGTFNLDNNLAVDGDGSQAGIRVQFNY